MLWLLASLVLGLGIGIISFTVESGAAPTLLLFVVIMLGGVWLCRRTQHSLYDERLSILSVLWLIKILMVFFLLYVGWIPQLDPSTSTAWGYDPQRYFYDAWQLISNDWQPVVGQNYQGIIFYYAVIFFVFGHNPVAPMLVNCLFTLSGTLFLIYSAYAMMPSRTDKDWYIAFLLLVPELLWYDVLTSRETLMAVLIILSTMANGRYLIGVGRTGLLGTLLLSGTALAGIIVTRTSMAIPVLASIGAMAFLPRSDRRLAPIQKLVILATAVGIVAMGPLVQNIAGGYEFDYQLALARSTSFESNIASQPVAQWSSASIGLLFAPTNAASALLFLPLRMLLYLATPLPNVAVSVTGLLNGSWSQWQHLMTVLTSAIMLLAFPYVLAGSARAWRSRKELPALMVLPISFWMTFVGVAGGNIIIHERYRVMSTLLLFGCMWLGYTQCTAREVVRWAVPWFAVLALAAVFYVAYKLIG